MPAGRDKEEHPRGLVQKAIKKAEKVAGNDNVKFVRALRAIYFSDEKSKERGKRSLAPDTEQTIQDLKIFQDPRYARNARMLAERTNLKTKKMRILGGTLVLGSDFPDCVAVGDREDWGCSGTLIAPDVVLTAGHCTTDMARICIGKNVKKPNRIVTVNKAIPHPNYSFPSNDLMLLILDEKIRNVAPRSLAPKTLIQRATDVRAVGFGTTDKKASKGYGIKRMVDVPVASNGCDGTFDGHPDASVYGCKPGLELIAGKPLLEKDTCKGDSGGPIYVSDSKGSWYLAGVTSRGTDLSSDDYDCGDGGVYVRVDSYRDWIKSALA
jgi:hypothetical protein